MNDLIYLDNNATTKMDSRVLEEMMPYLTSEYGNPASDHEFGTLINQKVKEARSRVAAFIGSENNEIIFTSGATESINLAIKGVIKLDSNKGHHIITVVTEHPAVLDTCKFIEKEGTSVTYLPVQSDGLIDLKQLELSFRPETTLVIIMLVNNETGVIQPIKEISQIAHAKGALLMTDATQAVGKIDVKVDELGVDLMAFSGHKFYGPKGIGVLFVRNRKPNKVRMNALIHGGGHERGLRSGTLNVPGIVGIGKAAEIANTEMAKNTKFITELRDYLEAQLLNIEDTIVNGNTASRLYNVTNIRFTGVDAEALIIGLKNVAVSNGSACTSTSIEPSHVLKGMALTDEQAFSAIRFSIGKFNTKIQLDTVISNTKLLVKKLRLMISG